MPADLKTVQALNEEQCVQIIERTYSFFGTPARQREEGTMRYAIQLTMEALIAQMQREAFEGLSAKLWCDLRTDEERSAWLLLGRGHETGVVAKALQNDLAMAYHRLALLSAPQPASIPSAEARRAGDA